jgi:SAM-dependent methyltransferase
MEREFEKKYHTLEKDHWWFISRRDAVRRIVNKYDKSIRILEIGCSSGQLIDVLNGAKYSDITGVDISKDAVHFCKRRNMRDIIQMDGSKMGFKRGKFDLIIASDILEHMDDDFHAIREWRRVLKENGEIVAFVPAFRFLWSDHDEVNKHFRRYNKRELISLFKENGFEVVRVSYWNFFLFFPVLIVRLIKRKIIKFSKPKDELFRVNKIVNKFLVALLRVENIYCNCFNLPVGLSLFIIAKKL